MAINKIFLVYAVLDVLFFLCGGVHLAVPIVTRMAQSQPPQISNIAQNTLLSTCALTASMANSMLYFLAFALSLPVLLLPSKTLPTLQKYALSSQAYVILLCATVTLVLGLKIWFSTLQTKMNLAAVWTSLPSTSQSLLQQKFNCCGYADSSIFVSDPNTCTSVAQAASLGPCLVPFSTFANRFLDVIFTTFFGFVAIDVLLLLAGLCLMKDRKERIRYRLIDEKSGPI